MFPQPFFTACETETKFYKYFRHKSGRTSETFMQNQKSIGSSELAIFIYYGKKDAEDQTSNDNSSQVTCDVM